MAIENLNPFGLSGLLAGISSTCFGLLVLLKAPNRRIGRIWFIFAIAVAFWGFGDAYISLIRDPSKSLLVWRCTYAFGANAIPVLFYHFVNIFCERNRFRSVIIQYVIGFGFFLIAFTRLFYSSVYWAFNSFYYCEAGPLYLTNTLWWLSLVAYSHWLLYRAYNDLSSLKKSQIKYFFLATTVGFLGGIYDFLPPLHINIYPWGNFTICLYPILMSYAILRHRLMDIALVAREAITKLATLGLLFVPLYLGRMLTETILSLHLTGLTRTGGTLIASMLFLSVGITLLRESQNRLANLLIRFCLLLGFWNAFEIFLDIRNFTYALQIYRLAYAMGSWVVLAWYEYWAEYIGPQAAMRKSLYRYIKVSAYVMSALAIFTPWVVQGLRNDPHLPAYEIPGRAYWIFATWFLSTVFCTAVPIALAIRRKAIVTSKIPWRSFLETWILGPTAAMSYFAYVSGHLRFALHPWLEIMMVIPLVGSFLKHGDHEARSRWAFFGSGALAFSAPFIAGFLLTQGAYMQILACMILVAVLPQLYREMERSIQAWVDMNIFEGRFSYLNQLAGIRKQAFRYINLRDMLVQSLDSVVQAMRLQSGALYLHNLTANAYEPIVTYPDHQTNAYESYSESDPLVASLRQENQMTIAIKGLSHHALALTYEKGLFGFFLLGPKEDGSELHDADFRELADLRGALEHVLWYTHVFYDQSLMLSKFSHDNIRYANNIRQQVEALLKPDTGSLNDFQKHVINLIEHGARMLEEYLQDLRVSMTIAAQRIGGTYRMSNYNLAELALEVLESQHLRAKSQGIQFTSPLLGMEKRLLDKYTAWGEMRSIRHIIENLLSNAIKFTPKGGTIRLDLKLLSDQLELIVSDTGAGIPDEDLPHIFDLFYQGKSRRNMHESTGLGLSIVKDIVAIHHGNIDVESERGQGTTFFVRLPVQPFATAKAA